MTNQLSHLAKQLVEKGPNEFHADLVRLAARVRCVAPGAAAALANPEASDVSRLRAFSVAARWLHTDDNPCGVGRVA